uniref:Uncharacterized protein n=1 Tax=Amphimedon queenslandica TaxID=400682 RepID=A0A1X7UIS2_AMPQE
MASQYRRRVKQGVRLNSQAKEIVSNVYKYFKDLERRSKEKGAFYRTLEATGISRPTLYKVVNTEEAGSSFGTQERRYKKTRARVVTDSFDVEAIRRKIYEQYEKNKRITLNRLLHIVKQDQVFTGGRNKLAALLKEIGFKYRSIDDCRYYEQPRIVEQRHKYVHRMMQNRVNKKPVVFLGETWANSHDGKDLALVENYPVTKGHWVG